MRCKKRRRCLSRRCSRSQPDFLRNITSQWPLQGGWTLTYVCPRCHCFFLERTTFQWDSAKHGDSNKKMQCNRLYGSSSGRCNWRDPNRTFDSPGQGEPSLRSRVQGACTTARRMLQHDLYALAERATRACPNGGRGFAGGSL